MTAFVLGNGTSRLAVELEKLTPLGSIYGCNALYRTFAPTALVATDSQISQAIQESGYSKKNRFYTRNPLPESGAFALDPRYRSYSSGPNAVAIAAKDGHKKVYLLGFDMAPSATGCFNNVYADTEFYKSSTATPTYTGNWVRQLRTVFTDYTQINFVRVVGETSAEIEEFENLTNLKTMAISEFLDRINTGSKDL